MISHVIGRGAPELVRFWGEPPLVREPDVAVFGIDRLDQPEQQWLGGTPLQHYLAADIKRRGAAVAAQEALERVHGRGTSSCCTWIWMPSRRRILGLLIFRGRAG